MSVKYFVKAIFIDHIQGHIHSPQSRTGGQRAYSNKVGYTATPVMCRWAGAVKEKVIGASGQEG